MAASVSAEAENNTPSTRPANTLKDDHGNMNIVNGGSNDTPENMLPSHNGNVITDPTPSPAGLAEVAGRIGNLNLQAPPQDALATADDTPVQIQRPHPVSRESAASDESQRGDSCSELGTKPPSLDGKSITSGTTFALDEKESLRPDDSASVKAAGEDDDAFSIRGSLIAGSRMGSDLAARARGIQLGDMPDRRLMQVTPGSSGHGILTPQSTSSEQQSRTGAEIPPLAAGEVSADALNLIYQHAPDEKLIEAMSTPKDRIYLLLLEKEVINFVQNSGYESSFTFVLGHY